MVNKKKKSNTVKMGEINEKRIFVGRFFIYKSKNCFFVGRFSKVDIFTQKKQKKWPEFNCIILCWT